MADPPRPPPRSPGSEYAEAIKGVLEGAATRDAPTKGKPAPRRRPGKVVWALVVILLGSPWAVWENYRYFRPPGPPPVEVQERAARVMMFSAAQALEQQRRTRGSLPANLSGLLLPHADWAYVRSDTGYVLTVTLPGTTLSYRSGEDYRELLRDAGVR